MDSGVAVDEYGNPYLEKNILDGMMSRILDIDS